MFQTLRNKIEMRNQKKFKIKNKNKKIPSRKNL